MALKAATANPVPVVTFHVDITPPTAEAATFVVWCNHVTPSLDNMTATLPATDVSGPLNVFVWPASHEYYVGPIVSWVFWGDISYNFNGGFDTPDNQLTFANTNLVYTIPSPTTAGSYAGSNGNNQLVAVCKNEIIGTLHPSGIGDVLNDIGNIGFTFNWQIATYNIWGDTVSPTDTHTSVGPVNDTPGFYVGITQQITPVHDKVFAIDAVGKYATNGLNSYTALAANFTNYIYIGSVKASDPNTWHSFTQDHFTGNNVVFTSTPNCGSGNPTLPTTWTDSSW